MPTAESVTVSQFFFHCRGYQRPMRVEIQNGLCCSGSSIRLLHIQTPA